MTRLPLHRDSRALADAHLEALYETWADAVRGGGRVPLYGTWWGNLASRGVTRRLGLELYGEDWHIDRGEGFVPFAQPKGAVKKSAMASRASVKVKSSSHWPWCRAYS